MIQHDILKKCGLFLAFVAIGAVVWMLIGPSIADNLFESMLRAGWGQSLSPALIAFVLFDFPMWVLNECCASIFPLPRPRIFYGLNGVFWGAVIFFGWRVWSLVQQKKHRKNLSDPP